MDTGPAGLGLAADDKSSSSPAEAFSRWSFTVSRRFQHFLDKSTPHLLYRWLGCLGVALIYALRVYLVEGFYIISHMIKYKYVPFSIGKQRYDGRKRRSSSTDGTSD
ncbi:hypothetical protein F8388_007776 [Cannabis sativa]|uniref:Uncharacterized protein n=1 Tax=Cannabis sativa TaxID=3483 RepID=A0A7J6FVU5_CANSA|nr:hypothetical protein F8388_007776 [Cannabis sativa]